jgi:hypothetical protein
MPSRKLSTPFATLDHSLARVDPSLPFAGAAARLQNRWPLLLWHEPESFREQVSSFLFFSPPLQQVGSLVPRHVGGLVDHVVSLPSRDGDERDLHGLVTDLLEVGENLCLDFIVSASAYLTVLSSILLQATIICLTPRV